MPTGIRFKYAVIGLSFAVRPEVGVLFVQGSDAGHAHIWTLCIARGAAGVSPFGNLRHGVKRHIDRLLGQFADICITDNLANQCFVSGGQHITFERGRFHLTAQIDTRNDNFGTISSVTGNRGFLFVVLTVAGRVFVIFAVRLIVVIARCSTFQLSQQGFEQGFDIVLAVAGWLSAHFRLFVRQWLLR
nr:MAG TPA: hypothetical protein [Caudoviricetes sp.]